MTVPTHYQRGRLPRRARLVGSRATEELRNRTTHSDDPDGFAESQVSTRIASLHPTRPVNLGREQGLEGGLDPPPG
jgi:hypothetical protein